MNSGRQRREGSTGNLVKVSVDHDSLRRLKVRGECQTREDEIHSRCFSESVIDGRISDSGDRTQGASH